MTSPFLTMKAYRIDMSERIDISSEYDLVA